MTPPPSLLLLGPSSPFFMSRFLLFPLFLIVISFTYSTLSFPFQSPPQRNKRTKAWSSRSAKDQRIVGDPKRNLKQRDRFNYSNILPLADTPVRDVTMDYTSQVVVKASGRSKGRPCFPHDREVTDPNLRGPTASLSTACYRLHSLATDLLGDKTRGLCLGITAASIGRTEIIFCGFRGTLNENHKIITL